ncbi:regulatory protein, tetR family [Sinosporangium album]|uniref:Regulatory protein, tetR family n=1 Tax=Sinosporangium album TaxID=504805 RepID=A0A1G7T004_9ACTN|nr:TetR family transcriptional regulator [Sinosporangium album]SDG28647.1 regulatory protein, tetR family [Sinosporangium album]
MAANPLIRSSRPRSRWAAGLPAVTAEQIIDRALELTAEHGLDGWTLRQLAAAIEAYPAVIYHHIGDREAVVLGVLERVVGMMPLPPGDLPWRDWFRVLVGELRTVLRGYPGVAHRLAVYGPTVQGAVPIIDRGVRLLQDAGFGKESVLAYSMILSTACQFVSVEDERRRGAMDRTRMVDVFGEYRDNADMPGLAAMGAFAYELAENPEKIAGYYASLYDYAVERTLDGVAQRLEDLTDRP